MLPTDLADSLRRAVGFRNVLVQDYVEVDDGIVLERLAKLADVDDGIVLERLAKLADLDDFVAVVATWVVPPRS